MQSFSTLSHARLEDLPNLVWKQPKFSSDYYQLCTAKQVFADLAFTTWFSDKAEARSAHGSWVLDRVGIFRDPIRAWKAGSNIEIATAVRGWLGDYNLSLHAKDEFQFYRTKILANRWALTDNNNLLVYEIQFGMHWFKQYNPIKLDQAIISSHSTSPDHLDLLLILGMYLGYCNNQDAAGAVAATSAAVIC